MLHKLRLRFQSNLTNTSYPIFADTLFGHICWAIHDLEGEAALTQFLAAYDENTPPLLLSDGFPADTWPRPKLKPLPRSLVRDLFHSLDLDLDSREGGTRFQQLQNIDSLTRLEWEQLVALGQEGFNAEQILRLLANRDPRPRREWPSHVDISHNVIDRLTGLPLLGERGHFYSQEYVCTAQTASFDLYVQLAPDLMSQERLSLLLKYIGRIGYGKDKSTGKGAFTVNLPDQWETLTPPTQGNRVLSLSVGIPCANLTQGYYTLISKYGRLGGHWATHGQPHKKPLLMHTAGSTYTPLADLKPYYGSLLKGVHPNLTPVRHYAYLLVWPFVEV